MSEVHEHFCLKHKLSMTVHSRHAETKKIKTESYHECGDKDVHLFP